MENVLEDSQLSNLACVPAIRNLTRVFSIGSVVFLRKDCLLQKKEDSTFEHTYLI